MFSLYNALPASSLMVITTSFSSALPVKFNWNICWLLMLPINFNSTGRGLLPSFALAAGDAATEKTVKKAITRSRLFLKILFIIDFLDKRYGFRKFVDRDL